MDQQSSGRLSHASLQQAAHWYVQLQDQASSDEQHRQWQAWFEHSAEHRQAWAYVERIHQRLLPLQETNTRQPASQALRSNRRAPLARRQVLGALLLAGLGWSTWRGTALPQALSRWRADYATGTGEIRDTLLSDGTHLWLNALSAVDVLYSSEQRLLALRLGEILIDTAKDPQRPFLVQTDHGRLRALGTRFSVRCNASDSQLNVYAGAVEVRSTDGRQVQVVNAGQQLRFDNLSQGQLQAASSARQAWSRGLLLADNLPLEQLLEELGRYRGGHLGCDPAIARLPVMGSFPLHDPDQALALLEAALPVRVRRLASWWVTLEPRT